MAIPPCRWSASQDLKPALAAIRWDAPVVTWGTNALGTQVARLTHPLAVLVSLGNAQLADQVLFVSVFSRRKSIP